MKTFKTPRERCSFVDFPTRVDTESAADENDQVSGSQKLRVRVAPKYVAPFIENMVTQVPGYGMCEVYGLFLPDAGKALCDVNQLTTTERNKRRDGVLYSVQSFTPVGTKVEEVEQRPPLTHTHTTPVSSTWFERLFNLGPAPTTTTYFDKCLDRVRLSGIPAYEYVDVVMHDGFAYFGLWRDGDDGWYNVSRRQRLRPGHHVPHTEPVSGSDYVHRLVLEYRTRLALVNASDAVPDEDADE